MTSIVFVSAGFGTARQQPVTDFQIADSQIHYLADSKIVAEHLQLRTSRESAIPAEILKEKTAMLSPGKLLVVGEKVEVWGY